MQQAMGAIERCHCGRRDPRPGCQARSGHGVRWRNRPTREM